MMIIIGYMYKYFSGEEGLHDPNDFKVTVGTEISHLGTWQKTGGTRTRT
jgi:hypothetical protein